MGYILEGKFYKGSMPGNAVNEPNSMHKSWSHDRQREDHRVDIIQPHNRDGTPNEEFIEYYPEESKDYGFIKEEE